LNPNSIAELAEFTNRYLALIQANVDADGGPDWRYHFRKRLAMSEISIRPAERADVARLTEIYNYYVLNTAVTFDIEPYTVEKRCTWFEQFSSTGRRRLLVADEDGVVLGYVGTTRFGVKAAYETTVETTIYCDPKAIGRRIGTRLYEALFDALKHEDVNRLVAGYTLPNDASAALHARCGFKPVGIYTEVGRKFGRYWDVAWTERPLKLS
jgi:phosphinothricin acetyltransferase